MDRRDLITGAALLAGSSVTSSASHAMSLSGGSLIPPERTANNLLDGPLIKKERAQQVLEEHDLQGLIALRKENVFYLTNTVPLIGKMGGDYPGFATYPRDPDQPTFLVASVAQGWDLANNDRWTPDFIPFSGPVNSADYMGEAGKPLSQQPIAGQFSYFFGDLEALTQREKRWRQSDADLNPAPSAEWALARALKDSGITRGRVAVDDMRIAMLLQRIGQAQNIDFIDGAQAFREIRVIKSPREQALMRIAATNNAEAVMATARQIEKGMTNADLERIFLSEAGTRGNEFIFLLAGFATGGLADGEVTTDRPFLIDAVSEFSNYNGDFARTFTLNELSQKAKKIVAAQQVARREIFDALRPGLKFSQIRKIGIDAFRKAGGIADAFIVNPHSVGLEHADQPGDMNNPWRGRKDTELKAGMTITVDLPYLEIGGGLSGHHEDLILITQTGYEALTPDYPEVVYI